MEPNFATQNQNTDDSKAVNNLMTALKEQREESNEAQKTLIQFLEPIKMLKYKD